MSNELLNQKTITLPVLALRGLPVFPYMIINFDVARPISINAIEESMLKDQLLMLCAQKDIEKTEIDTSDLYEVGTIARVKQILRISDDDIRVLVEGVQRAKILKFTSTFPYIECEASEYVPYLEKTPDEILTQNAYMKEITKECQLYFSLLGKIAEDNAIAFGEIKDADQFADMVASALLIDLSEKQSILEEFDLIKRLEMILEIIKKEIQILKLEKSISHKVKSKLEEHQKEYYLREQIKVLKDELGEGDEINEEKDEIFTNLEKVNAPSFVIEKCKKEFSKLEKMQPQSPDASLIRNYLDFVSQIPWGIKDEETKDIKKVKDVLERDHYGLLKVKERILEFLSARIFSGGKKSPIICLYGPPGVGKTSVAKSIAEALSRKYVRLSLGGVKDEAEIRGHRKTYVGAMAGRIVTALKKAKSMNPVILLDEIDKVGIDQRGNISASLLEVLDSEQNKTFRDNYLELETDLSDVLFITTANSLETIDPPLLDRMEIIELSGYTDIEKLNISKKHIIPKQLNEHTVRKKDFKITDSAIYDIIHFYTRESGVRQLERKIAQTIRKAVCKFMEGEEIVSVNSNNLELFLGKRDFEDTKRVQKSEVGVCTGLAWTQYGGDVLSIEASVVKGNGSLELTGNLGDVMKESCKASISYVRANSEKFGIDPDFIKQNDIHIHVPEGAVPKDGPSAGITITCALISSLTNRKIKKSVAMTGEITITGRILAIGGLKEKSLAGYRMGIKTILIPESNKKDIDDIPVEVKEKVEFVLVDSIDKVLSYALE